MALDGTQFSLSGYRFVTATALGVRGDLDFYIDRQHHIVWFRSGLTDEEIGQALWHTYQELTDAPTPMPMLSHVPLMGDVA